MATKRPSVLALFVFAGACAGAPHPVRRPPTQTAPPAEAPRGAEEEAAEDDALWEARQAQIQSAVNAAVAALRGGDTTAAAAALESYLQSHADEDPAPSRITAFLAHVRWLEALPRVMQEAGARWLETPRRGYVNYDTAVLDAPGGEPRGSFGSLDLDAVDVWAEVPGGPLLIARPNEAPAFEVRSSLLAIAGWVQRQDVAPQPSGEQTLDTGRPLAIQRAPRIESESADVDGQRCRTADGTDGLCFVLNAGTEVHCEPLLPLCGAPGLVPATYEFDEAVMCADCVAQFRSFVREENFCRSMTPGSRWRCAPGNEHLVCTAPGATPEAVEPPPAGPPIPPAQSGDAELQGLLRRLRGGPAGQEDPMLEFHARAHREALLELLCSHDELPSQDALIAALATADAFAYVEDSRVSCLNRLSGTRLRRTLAELPDPRLRDTLEAIAAEPMNGRDAELAQATLGVIESAERGTLPELITRHVGDDTRFFNTQRVAAERLRDPRPTVPGLIVALTHPSASHYVRRTARNRLRRMGVPTESDEEARAFYAAHRHEPLDAWMAAAIARADDAGRMSLYRAWIEREPGPAGVAALLRGLEDPVRHTRDDAAIALARWGDRRAIPVLAAHLPSRAAFLGLAWLHESSMGYGRLSPETDVDEVVEVVRRWRAWAEREAPQSP